MSLSKRLAGEFGGTDRNRGTNYFLAGCVNITDGSSTMVEARVRGSRVYEVSLELADSSLGAWCDCPKFDSDPPCKHLWALILAAERRGLLSAAASLPNLVLDCGDGFDDEEDEDFFDLENYDLHLARSPAAKPVPRQPQWLKQLTGIFDQHTGTSRQNREWPAKKEIVYVVDVPGTIKAGCLKIWFGSHDRKQDGTWTRLSSLSLNARQVTELPLKTDREIIGPIVGGLQYFGYSQGYVPAVSSYLLQYPVAASVMHLMAATGRCFLQKTEAPDDLIPLSWDDGGPWRFALDMHRTKHGWAVAGTLCRGDERMTLASAALVTEGGFVFTDGRVAPLEEDVPFEWLFHFRKQGQIEAPEKDRDELLAALLNSPRLPALEVPEELRYEEITVEPKPGLHFRPEKHAGPRNGKLRADLSFNYEGRAVQEHEPAGGFYDAATRRFLRRNSPSEKAAAELLLDLGLKFQSSNYWDSKPAWELAPTKLPRTVRALVDAGWHIEAEGKVFRRPGAFRIDVSSGVDWFELRGGVEYGDTAAQLPELLAALRRGDNMVRLDDGSFGMLPDDWLRRIGMLAGAGTAQDGHIRFRANQAGVLDALLAAQPEASCDATFARVREELGRFQGITPAAQPPGFTGHLRDYQREGLGWMEFLRRFSFGGCLADDMGVGKTAQVLALLDTRRELRASGEAVNPSLVVVPKSLVFNWKEESARFTPNLRVLDYTGLARTAAEIAAYDIVLTTYGTLRRDAIRLKDIEFDYVILDEAQAIKNANTESAKAVRLLRGQHRLALSGTPVENHLGELWSLIEFLNPGMLGTAGVFKRASDANRNPDEETRQMLARALRPFILRRTKDQVARELPPKSEQTVYCEMEPAQRKLYDDLRHHYRQSLLGKIQTDGLGKSKIQVLEALLRLRQAACHPGLLDPKRTAEPSAKLEVLLEQIQEVTESGHKALVFSQFTSLLAIVRNRLDASGIIYEYLDGATQDRQSRVERFQNDPACPLFLISLKAGGLGLNLTAAEYVFLLDPWWNPAVEAQAVDRAHRIGQTRQVFAYRLIARDTVEEKVLELQKNKRDLAAAIISADNSLIRNLQREDVELLLS